MLNRTGFMPGIPLSGVGYIPTLDHADPNASGAVYCYQLESLLTKRPSGLRTAIVADRGQIEISVSLGLASAREVFVHKVARGRRSASKSPWNTLNSLSHCEISPYRLSFHSRYAAREVGRSDVSCAPDPAIGGHRRSDFGFRILVLVITTVYVNPLGVVRCSLEACSGFAASERNHLTNPQALIRLSRVSQIDAPTRPHIFLGLDHGVQPKVFYLGVADLPRERFPYSFLSPSSA